MYIIYWAKCMRRSYDWAWRQIARYRYNIDLVCPNNHRGDKGDPSIKGSHLNPSVLYCSQSAWHKKFKKFSCSCMPPPASDCCGCRGSVHWYQAGGFAALGVGGGRVASWGVLHSQRGGTCSSGGRLPHSCCNSHPPNQQPENYSYRTP